MNNKHLSSTTEAKSEGILNNSTEPIVSHATMNFCFNEKTFDAIMNTVKGEIYSHIHDEANDSDDSANTEYIDGKNKKPQDKICESAPMSYENNVNVSESNLQELTDTRLVDGKILRSHTNSPFTAFPIMKILSLTLQPHTCLEHCFKCNMVFRLLDSPSHICRIRSIDKLSEFLKIEPSLCVDSCLCDFCWKYLEKTYKSNKSKNRKEESFSEKKFRLLERYVKKNVPKNQNQARICSILSCMHPSCCKMTANECEDLKQLFSTFEYSDLIIIQSAKQITELLEFPLCLCNTHLSLIQLMIACQICGAKLNAPFNIDDWSMYKMWNFVLIEYNLPLILKPGMFLCVTCKRKISKANPGFPTTDLPSLREFILSSNSIRSKIYGDSQYNLFNICQGSKNLDSPLIVPIIEEVKERVRSKKISFSDPLITNYDFKIAYYENNTKSITSTALLKIVKQNLCTSKLEPKDEGLDFVKHEEEYFKTYTTDITKFQFENLYTDPILNTSGIEMTSSLNINADDTSENILSEQNLSANLTDYNISNYYSYATTNNVGDDNNKDWLQLHVDYQFENYDTKISTTEENSQHLGNANDNSLQNVCEVDKEEIDEKESANFGSYQVVSLHNKNENNQSKPNSLVGCSVTHDGCSMDIKEGNHCTNDINTIHETVCLNETDSSIYSSTAVEPPNVMIDQVSIIRKLSDILCDTISNKDVKKQRLNEKYSFYENNFIEDDTTTSYKNKNITHPSILNTTSNCKNKCEPNSDIFDFDSLSDSEMFSESDSEEILAKYEVKETDYIIVTSADDLNLDLDSKSVQSELEIKPDHEIEMDCISIPSTEKSLDGNILLNRENILENNTTQLRSRKNSYCEIVLDSETESDSDEQPHRNISVTDEELNNKKLSTIEIVTNVQKESNHEILLDGEKSREMLSKSENSIKKCMIASNNAEEVNNKKVSDITITSFPCVEQIVYEDGDTKQAYVQEHVDEMYSSTRNHFGDTENQSLKQLYSQKGNDDQYSQQILSDNIEPLKTKHNIITSNSSSTQSNSIASPKKNVKPNNGVGSKFNNIITTKPLCNSVSKSRNNRISTNSVSKVPNDLSTYTKPLVSSGIPYLPDDNQRVTRLILEHTTECKVQLPVAIKKKTVSKSKVLLPS